MYDLLTPVPGAMTIARWLSLAIGARRARRRGIPAVMLPWRAAWEGPREGYQVSMAFRALFRA